MKYKVISLLLIFFILINFIYDIYYNSVNAEAITMTAGLAIFLKAVFATGVTYVAGTAVKELTEESIKLYQEWQEFIKKQPPEKKPPNDWEKQAWLYLMGVSAVNVFKNLVDSVKDFFDELGSKEGNNYYDDSGIVYLDNNIYETEIQLNTSNEKEYRTIRLYYNNNLIEIPYYTYRWTGDNYAHFGFSETKERYLTINGEDYNFWRKVSYRFGNRTSITIRVRITNKIELRLVKPENALLCETDDISKVLTNDYELETEPINYYFENNTYQFTNNEDDIRYVYPDIESILKDKIIEITNPDGTKYSVYPGTYEDLYNEWSQNINPENIFIETSPNYRESEEGIIIIDNKDELPFPEPEPEPEPDVETGLGKIISLLKQIINWLSNIYNNISELPQKIGNLFFNPDDIENIDFSPITNVSISDKFPFSIPWDLKEAVELLASEGKPPKWEIPIVTETITIDMAEFEHLAGIMRVFNTLLFVVALIILTRRLI